MRKLRAETGTEQIYCEVELLKLNSKLHLLLKDYEIISEEEMLPKHVGKVLINTLM